MFAKNMAQGKLRNWITNVTARSFLQTLLVLSVNHRVVQGQAKTVSSLQPEQPRLKKICFICCTFTEDFRRKSMFQTLLKV